MKKISVEKTDDIATIIDNILELPDTSVVLVVPRATTLGASLRNFHLLKREMDAAGRSLEIESVDDQILAFAKAAKIPARHPLLNRTGASVSDIVAVVHEETEETVVAGETAQKKTGGKKRAAEKSDEPIKIEVREEATTVAAIRDGSADEADEEGESKDGNAGAGDESAEEASGGFFGGSRFFKPSVIPDDDDDASGETSRSWGKIIGLAVIVIAIVVIGVLGVDRLFGHAQIAVNFQKTPWQLQEAVTVDKSLAAINLTQTSLPAEVFTASKNVTQTFPASGSANVSQKAQGTITVYNAYSSSPQELVATTRFVTPSGQIFRLVNGITVPGAQITNGQIVPSSIDAPIIADQAGAAGNVGAVPKLTVPGFENTPKYAGFYGAIASGTSGGFVGNKAVPTDQDVANAKASTTAVLQAALTNTTSLNIPSNFKILDGATNVAITRLIVSTTTDQNGNFTVFGEVSYQAIGFDESMLKYMLQEQAQATEASSTFSDLALTYSNVAPNFTDGTMTFTVAAQGSLEPAFSSSTFAASLAGASIGDARATVAAISGLTNGSISVWPVWLWNLPTNPAKISVTVD